MVYGLVMSLRVCPETLRDSDVTEVPFFGTSKRRDDLIEINKS